MRPALAIAFMLSLISNANAKNGGKVSLNEIEEKKKKNNGALDQ